MDMHTYFEKFNLPGCVQYSIKWISGRVPKKCCRLLGKIETEIGNRVSNRCKRFSLKSSFFKEPLDIHLDFVLFMVLLQVSLQEIMHL